MVRRLPRISILTALLLMTILGMAIVVAQLWREISPLHAANKRFNEERGTLVIGDPTKLHAIQIPSRFAGEGRQSYRVYVPPGQNYVAYLRINGIPKDGLPERKVLPDHAGILGVFQGQLHGSLKPGEHVVTVRTVQSSKRTDIQLIVDFLDAYANTAEDGWPTAKPETYAVYGSDSVRSSTVDSDGSQPLVLLRHRIEGVTRESTFVSYTIPEPTYPLDGMILWLERAPDKPKK